MTNSLIKPNFFIIGAPRSGTTALSTYLKAHPNVFFSTPKEPQFFATDFRSRFVARESIYLSLFRGADPAIHLAIGEGSTWYLFSREAIPNILAFQPDARFIVSIRHPAKMVLSFHRFLVMQGKENQKDFWKAWLFEKKRRNGKRIPCAIAISDEKFVLYSEWGKLGSQLQRLFSLVPRERVLVIMMDRLVRSPRSVWMEVQKFLQIPDDGRLEFPRVNESIDIPDRLLPFWYTMGIFRSFLSRVRSWVGSTIYTEISYAPALRLVESFSPTRRSKIGTEKRNEADRQTLVKLTEYYKNEILLLSSLTGENLDIWLDEPWKAA